VDRLACVDLPALPLQILLQQHPDWVGHPAVVVAEDRPQAPITWVNERARANGILPGMRYAAGLSLSSELRAGVIGDEDVEDMVGQMVDRLWRFSPAVEPAEEEPGVFWLDASGLQRLYPSLEPWADEVRGELEELGFEATVTAGFSRFGSYALARAGRSTVLTSRQQETALARRVPLARLGIEPGFRDALDRLGITTLDGLVALPAAGIRERFGDQAWRLHRMAAGDLWTPLQPLKHVEPLAGQLLLTEPVGDTMQLLFHVKGLLHPLLRELARRGEALTSLDLRLVLERGDDHSERIVPAAPTLDGAELLLLARLRFEALDLPAGALEIHLVVDAVAASQAQQQLVGDRPARDLAEANRALAFLRAEFGAEAVVTVRLRDGHLPEASFAWEPRAAVTFPTPAATSPTLVRRLHTRPATVHQPNGRDPRGWMLHRLGRDTITTWTGPHVIRGGWWARELHREYWYVTTRDHELLWLYHDRLRRRWAVQGIIQ
jgi:protein ImuB